MQLALFDSLEELYEAGADYWDEHMRELDRHTIITPSPGALGVGAGAPPVAVEDGLLLFYHERTASSQYTIKVALLDDETGRVESHAPGADHSARSSRGSAPVTSTTSSSCRALLRDPTARSISPTAPPTAASARRASRPPRSSRRFAPPPEAAAPAATR